MFRERLRINQGDSLTPFQATWFRAGHAHAGVLLLMSRNSRMRERLLVLIVALVAGAAPVHAQLGTAADEAAIRKILDVRNAPYNNHDAKLLAATYAPNADLVTGTGRVISGRAAIEQNYQDLWLWHAAIATVGIASPL